MPAFRWGFWLAWPGDQWRSQWSPSMDSLSPSLSMISMRDGSDIEAGSTCTLLERCAGVNLLMGEER